MLKHYGLTFLPWIALAIVSDIDVRAGAIAGLVCALALLARDRRAGHHWDSLILEISTGVYMAALTAVAVAAPDASMMEYGASMAMGWLALTAWCTLALHRPFTEGIARRQVSAEIAATALFRRINVVLTIAWAVAFTVTACALACLQHWAPHATGLLVACKIAGFAVPAFFTARYPEIARARYFTRNGITEPSLS